MLLEPIDKTIPTSLSQSGIHELFGGLNSREESDITIYEIPVSLLITKLGGDHFWKAIDIFLRQVDKQYEDALKVIQQQEKRKEIFSKRQRTENRKHD